MEAAQEVARQLRLRDVGGIIVCDFIDMETKANRERVLQELRQHLSRDRARTKAFAVSDLGLIEMTRQRVRQSRRDNLLIKLHPDVAMYVLEQERDLAQKLQKAANFSLEFRDDPLLKPDEFKLVVKAQGRDVTQQYAIA
jgi:Ribonuclease G/E